jgi:hypothetical protein
VARFDLATYRLESPSQIKNGADQVKEREKHSDPRQYENPIALGPDKSYVSPGCENKGIH